MKRIDLIIDALESVYTAEDMGVVMNALAAARELRELKPVGITLIDGAALFDGVVLPEETLLYALDEVTK